MRIAKNVAEEAASHLLTTVATVATFNNAVQCSAALAAAPTSVTAVPPDPSMLRLFRGHED
eukprot:718831-Alexandrium_andersonii.AAC.1